MNAPPLPVPVLVDPNTHYLTHGNVADLNARYAHMEDHLGKDSRRPTDVPFQMNEKFCEYERQHLILLDDFHLKEIADHTFLRPVPMPGVHVALTAARQRNWDYANKFVYKITFRGLSLENGGLDQVSGVEVNDGAALFQRLREKNYGIADHSLPNVKSAFFNPTIFRQARNTSIESW